MLLYEFEGKKLFRECGINVPQSQLIDSPDEEITIKPPFILKAQTLSGKRAEAGGIVIVKEINDSHTPASQVRFKIKELFQKKINNEKVEKVLVEEAVEIEKEYYLSFSYSTETRNSVMTFGEGGSKVGSQFDDSRRPKPMASDEASRNIDVYPVDILKGYSGENVPEELMEVAKKLWEVFTKYDCELAEINPLVVDKNRRVWALDAKVILDDDGDFRREVKFPERNLFGRPPTENEIKARKIDEGDHRGTAGSVYWDLDGDIAVIAAGGGGSIVNMDALLAFGGKPANYTEHSGNPPREKLKRLTEIVLSKPDLKGCWLVGGTANFTDIYETLAGFVEGLRELKPKPTYPIVIRRGGPRDKEAFEALAEIGKKEGFDFRIFGRETPMTSTAKVMVELAYGNTGNK